MPRRGEASGKRELGTWGPGGSELSVGRVPGPGGGGGAEAGPGPTVQGQEVAPRWPQVLTALQVGESRGTPSPAWVGPPGAWGELVVGPASNEGQRPRGSPVSPGYLRDSCVWTGLGRCKCVRSALS
ncbi:hypothetical protein VULLAG_LOCUS7007 [Vulpes lagopus]